MGFDAQSGVCENSNSSILFISTLVDGLIITLNVYLFNVSLKIPHVRFAKPIKIFLLLSGKHRQVEVKLKCKPSDSPSAVSLYLLEPRTCE